MASIAQPGVTRDVTAGTTAPDVGFPGRTVTGFCMIVAPILAIIGALASVSIYHAKGVDFATGMIGHHLRGEVAFNFAVAGTILLIFAIGGMAHAIARVRPRLGQSAGVLVIIGLCGPLFFNGVYFGGFQMMQFSQPSPSIAGKMMDQAQIIPSNIINISGPALVIGFILLGIGAAKAGVLPRWQSWALGLTCLVPFGFISGFMVITVVGFACTTFALLPLGVKLLRGHESAVTASA